MTRRPALLWAGALIVSGCLAPPPAFEVTLRLSPTPPLIGPTRLLVDVANSGGSPVSGASVSVSAVPDDLPGRTAIVSIAVDEGAGRYVVPGFDLDLGGPWTVTVTVSDSTGASITRAFPTHVYGGS